MRLALAQKGTLAALAFLLAGAGEHAYAAYAQVRCGTPDPSPRQMQRDTEAAKAFTAAWSRIAANVPVVVHVISRGSGTQNGDVPDSMIQTQINVMNTGFASTPFRFTLAGVTRTINPAWYTTA
jgi:hypothetical protein